jgi:o-succinylbenzoate---CoA ligase
MIDFSSSETHLLLNPRLPDEDRRALEHLAEKAPSLSAHVWIATSGTTGSLRLVALSKRALLASADAVNGHLEATERDAWLCVLPTFHVGGLGIFARAGLTRSRVISLPWDARQFLQTVAAENVTLSSLVPAQVRDLVALGERAPSSIRAIVVGGGAFSLELYAAARTLGWPVLPSYGMTEACSQIATANGSSPRLKILPHLTARAEADGRLAFHGSSLLSGYAFYGSGGQPSFVDPKVGGWFTSQDLGVIEGDTLRVTGRAEEVVKIGGETVDLARLDAILESVRGEADAAIIAVADARLGHVIHLATTADDAEAVRDAFNERVLPFERIREIRRVPSIPRSPLGKLLRARLATELR